MSSFYDMRVASEIYSVLRCTVLSYVTSYVVRLSQDIVGCYLK